MPSCQTIALFFVFLLINNVILIGIVSMAAYFMFQEEEAKSGHHRYGSYDDHFNEREPSSFKSKLAKFTSSSIIRRILEYIPGFEMIAQKLDSLSTVVYVALDAVFLPFEAIQSIHRWFNGEISGRRCAKTIVDASAAVAGGIGGAAVGASIGAVGGPVGSVIGGIIGGLFGSSVAATIMDHLTQRIFDLPKSIAVERAYHFLGLRPSASNYEINQAFRSQASHCHPDSQYGDEKKFMELQSNMQLIKEDRKRTFRS